MRTALVAIVACLALASACGGISSLDLTGVDEQLAPDGTDEDQGRSVLSASVGGKAKVVNTGGLGLRLRKGAGLDHAILLVMPQGSIVKVLAGPSAGWYKVEFEGQAGWSYGVYLAPVAKEDDSPAATPAAAGNHNLLPYRYGKRFHLSCGHGCYAHQTTSYWAWDFGMPVGTAIVASHAGTVRKVKGDSKSGACSKAYAAYANYVVIAKGDGTESLYLHLSSVAVSHGEKVSRGQLIGHSGQTGWSCGAHLHFQIQRSPVGGSGTSSYYNQSLHSYFYDSGSAHDPHSGEYPLSRNGAPSASALSTSGDDAGQSDDSGEQTDFSGGDADYDRIMGAAAASEE
jgi:hypothetical protein